MFSATELYPNIQVGNAVHEYCIEHSMPVGKQIDQHRSDTIKWSKENGANADMMVNTLQSQFLIWLARALNVKKVLEVGCFTGYSAISFAEALKDQKDAEIITLDLPGPSSTFAQETFDKTGISHIIKLIQGDASETIKTLKGKKFDMVFIDANKEGYVSYLNAVLELDLLAPGGVILADNALRRGLVADSSSANPASKDEEDLALTKCLDAFNKLVKTKVEEGVFENMLLPAFDGLNLIRLKASPN